MKGHHWFYYKHIGVEILRQSGPVFVLNVSACSLRTGHVACANDKWLEWVKLRSQWLPGVPAVFQQSSFPQPSPLLLTGLIIWHTSRSPLFHASSCCLPNWWLNTLERPSLLFYLFYIYISIRSKAVEAREGPLIPTPHLLSSFYFSFLSPLHYVSSFLHYSLSFPSKPQREKIRCWTSIHLQEREEKMSEGWPTDILNLRCLAAFNLHIW